MSLVVVGRCVGCCVSDALDEEACVHVPLEWIEFELVEHPAGRALLFLDKLHHLMKGFSDILVVANHLVLAKHLQELQ